MGAADRIFSRAVEIVELAEKQAAGASSAASDNSLMVLRNHFEQANKEHLSKKGLQTFKSRAVYLDEDAFADGESFGEQVGLNRQVNGGIKRIPQFDGR